MGSEEFTRVFVYGTLLRGERNHGILGTATFVCEGRTLRGFSLRDLGTYPALVRDDAGEGCVHGEVYLIDELTLAALDALEGHPDHYRRTFIMLQDGMSAQAYLRDDLAMQRYPRVESGNWRQREA